jgi:hypothetical protein
MFLTGNEYLSEKDIQRSVCGLVDEKVGRRGGEKGRKGGERGGGGRYAVCVVLCGAVYKTRSGVMLTLPLSPALPLSFPPSPPLFFSSPHPL